LLTDDSANQRAVKPRAFEDLWCQQTNKRTITDEKHNFWAEVQQQCSGDNIMWVDELRYLGVYIVRSGVFKCSLHKAKEYFYRAANNQYFGKSDG